MLSLTFESVVLPARKTSVSVEAPTSERRGEGMKQAACGLATGGLAGECLVLVSHSFPHDESSLSK